MTVKQIAIICLDNVKGGWAWDNMSMNKIYIVLRYDQDLDLSGSAEFSLSSLCEMLINIS